VSSSHDHHSRNTSRHIDNALNTHSLITLKPSRHPTVNCAAHDGTPEASSVHESAPEASYVHQSVHQSEATPVHEVVLVPPEVAASGVLSRNSRGISFRYRTSQGGGICCYISPEVAADAAEPPEVAATAAVFPEVMAPTAVSPETPAHAAEPPEAAVFASAPYMVVAPSNTLTLSQEPCIWPVTVTETVYEILSYPKPTMETTFELSACQVTANEIIHKLSTCPVTAKRPLIVQPRSKGVHLP
ncbi:hypothetical protein M9458_021605, partial [Cirrhinus mrigala]